MLLQANLSALMQARVVPLDTLRWLLALLRDMRVFASPHGSTPLTELVRAASAAAAAAGS